MNHKEEWECPNEIIRRHEETMIETKATLTAFMKRYENDRFECSQRYQAERLESIEWRENTDRKLDEIRDFLSEFKPNYKRIMSFAGILVFGSLGLVFKMIWDHTVGK